MKRNAIPSVLFGLVLSGCSTPNLVFVDHNKIAIAIGASLPDQKADITVGYESHSVALVPVTNPSSPDNRGKIDGAKKEDALSVFASFKSLGNSGQAAQFSLGRVFATGVAAQVAAENYTEAAKSEAQAKVLKEVNAMNVTAEQKLKLLNKE